MLNLTKADIGRTVFTMGWEIVGEIAGYNEVVQLFYINDPKFQRYYTKEGLYYGVHKDLSDERHLAGFLGVKSEAKLIKENKAKTTMINLYGGPGTGKSTYAAYLFSLLKQKGLDAELVTEYVKQWAWEDKKPVDLDQFYLFGKQAKKEYSLFDKVNLVVTDSPMLVCAYYAQLYGTAEQGTLFRHMYQVYTKMCQDRGVEIKHYFLKRLKPYNPKGRFQTEQEAKDIDQELKIFMKSLGIQFEEIDGSKEALEKLSEEFE